MSRLGRAALGCGLLAVVALAVAAVVGHRAWRVVHTPYAGYPGERTEVTIARGSSAIAIIEELTAAGVLADARLARAYFHWRGEPALQAGEYVFERPLAMPEVFAKLERGEVLLHPVTVIEGLTLTETAEHLADAGFGALDAFLAAMGRPDPIADLDPEARDLEGYLFPDTYHFPGGVTEEEIVEAMVDTFRRRWRQEVAPLMAEDDAPSVRETVILASVVEKEARLDDERPIIAGVYRNRLDRGIALYADPTVIYALKLAGTWDGNLRRPDLAYDSPYNTYVYPGLPPGPICSPGAASLVAATAPADVPYLYFVSRNDGSHVFASTLAEHNRNVNKWQKQYWRERWRREAAEKEGSPGDHR